MKTLDRNRIDQLVRELETDAYRRALALSSEPASAERILLEAFASLAPSLAATPQTVEIKERLRASIRQRGSRVRRLPESMDERSDQAAKISESLHLRIVDLLEEEQAVEPVGRRRAVFLGLGGVVLVAALAAYLWVRVDALAAAQPTVMAMGPPAGAKEVPVRGDFTVTFGQRPAGTPTLRLEPTDGVLDSAHWDGSTLVAGYSGLRLATRYQLVLVADYRSRFNDLGHYEKRWTLTTEGYPVLAAVLPQEGQPVVPRVGQLSVDFSHRPAVEPHLSLEPADGTMLPGQWSGTTLTISYSGLKPLTRYQATVMVDYGVSSANIRHQWTFSTEPGAPPAGVPVIWYSTWRSWMPSSGPQRLVAVDWSGNLVGTIYQASATQQSPDGSLFFTPDHGLVDRNGVQLGSAIGYRSNPMLADDSRSLCDLVDTGGGQLSLVTGPVRGPSHRVATVGAAGAQFGLGIIACSVTNDQAVVADNGSVGATAVRVIALSTGRVRYQRSYAGGLAFIGSSRDGRYLAETTATYDTQGQPLGAVTLIRRTADGKVLARMDNRRIVRFSWDGLRVVTAPIFPAQDQNEVNLVGWQTGKVLWRQAGAPSTNGQPIYAMPQPNGPDMAIAIDTLPRSGDVDQLWLVDADGQATQVVNEVFYPAFYAGF